MSLSGGLAGGWASLLKPVTNADVKKRSATPLTSAPISKCARLTQLDEKKKEVAEKKQEVADNKVKREISKAEKLAIATEKKDAAAQKKAEAAEKKEAAALKKEEAAQKKAEKDAHPKKPRTGYFIFCSTARVRIIEANPGIKSKVTEVSKLCAAEWKELSDDDKKPYEEEAVAEKATYLATCAEAGVEPDKRFVPKEPKEKKVKEPKEKKAKKVKAADSAAPEEASAETGEDPLDPVEDEEEEEQGLVEEGEEEQGLVEEDEEEELVEEDEEEAGGEGGEEAADMDAE